ncbi:hypothetical protein EIP86_004227 [Pleurotus ostreatoroseus]|nr:hypothetical protein EIP86_004227 [Pleurotus ostreatoroseus]
MSSSTHTYLAGDFVMSAGSVLFRRLRGTEELQICLIYHPDREQWLLPKGRKDCGETIEAAAIRETYEETGYICELVPLRMPTRATIAGESQKDDSKVRDAVLEPMAVVVQDREVKGVKVMWWFVTRVQDGTRKVEGTQMASENYESHFLEANEAIAKLTFEGYRDIAKKALELVRSTEASLSRQVI